MSKQDIMEIFSIDELESCFSIGQVKKFLRTAKRNQLPKGYEYKIVDKPVDRTKDCYNVYLVVAKKRNEDYLENAIPICFLRQG